MASTNYQDDLREIPDPYIVGSSYNSLNEYREALRRYSVARHLSYKVHKQVKSCHIVVCRDPSCSFRIRCKREGDNCVVTKSEPHQCLSDTHDKWRAPAAVQQLQPANQRFFEADNDMRPKEILGAEEAKGNKIGYKQAWRAINAHREKAFGDAVDSFKKLPDLLRRFKEADATTFYRLESVGGRFDRLFFAPGPCHRAFKYGRKFMALDGTFWKNKFDLILLIAVVLDGNNEIIPVSFAITTSESESNWRFFLRHLKLVVPEVDENTVTIISDRGKGLQAAISTELGRANQCFCLQHLCENIMQAFHPGDEARKAFWAVAKAPTERKFEQCLNRLEYLPKGEEVGDYLRAIPFERWANFAIQTPRYGHFTSNIAESINSAWKDTVREFSITEAVKAIWRYLTNKFYERRQYQFSSNIITDFAFQHIDEQTKLSRQYRVTPFSNTEFQTTQEGRSAIVHLDRTSCSCKEFQDLELPCRHALAVLSFVRRPYREFIGQPYYIENYRRIYEECFHAVDWDDLEDDDDCAACDFRRLRGRPTKRRRRHGERIYRRVNKCSACLKEGHDRRSTSCPMYGVGNVFVLNHGTRSRLWKWLPSDSEDIEDEDNVEDGPGETDSNGNYTSTDVLQTDMAFRKRISIQGKMVFQEKAPMMGSETTNQSLKHQKLSSRRLTLKEWATRNSKGDAGDVVRGVIHGGRSVARGNLKRRKRRENDSESD